MVGFWTKKGRGEFFSSDRLEVKGKVGRTGSQEAWHSANTNAVDPLLLLLMRVITHHSYVHWIALPLLLVCLAACRRAGRPAAGSESSSLDAAAREYVRLAVALGERDPDSIDFYTGPAAPVSDIRKSPPTWKQIGDSARQLTAKIRAQHCDEQQEALRCNYLAAQLHAVAARAALLIGERTSFDQESMDLFGVEAPQNLDDAKITKIRTELQQLLGSGSDLAERYGRYNARFLIPPAKLPAVMAAALDRCHQQTLAHLRLPADESVQVAYVSNKPWAGYSTYLGNHRSLVQINTDFALGPDDVLTLACHEAWPGHHAWNSLRDQHGRGWPEVSVQPTFSPQSLLSEGAATVAPDLAFSENARAEFERTTLFPLAGLAPAQAERYVHLRVLVDQLHGAEAVIAREYLEEKLEFVRAEDALGHAAVMPNPAATLLYLNEYRSYVVAYTVGRDRVEQCLRDASGQLSWAKYEQLMSSPDLLQPCG